MFPTVRIISSILSLHDVVQPDICKYFQKPGDTVFGAANLEILTNTVYLPLSPWFILLNFLITKTIFGV